MGRLTTRRRRRKSAKWKLHKPRWIDPFPHIPGTEPEKRIFAALVQRGIFFRFQAQVPELERGDYVTLAIPGYKPDFVVPHYKVIIDPFSEFHHSLPDAVERDIEKIALYTALGYAYYHPWASEVTEKGGLGILATIREFNSPPPYPIPEEDASFVQRGYRLGEFLGAGATSVAAANRKRRRPPSLSLSQGTRRRKRSRRL